MKTSGPIKNSRDLKAEIRRLEKRQFLLESEFKEGFDNLTDKLKPVNLLKTALIKVPQILSRHNNILGYALGLGAGFAAKKFLFGKAGNLVKKTLGNAVELGVAKLVSGNINRKNSAPQAQTAKS